MLNNIYLIWENIQNFFTNIGMWSLAVQIALSPILYIVVGYH